MPNEPTTKPDFEAMYQELKGKVETEIVYLRDKSPNPEQIALRLEWAIEDIKARHSVDGEATQEYRVPGVLD